MWWGGGEEGGSEPLGVSNSDPQSEGGTTK